ncbi:hypothetical protein ACOSOMT5_P0690 [Acidiphilium sp. MT5]
MATKSLEVVIGADTADLEAKMAVAKASLGQVNSEIKVLAKQATVAGGEIKSGLMTQLTALTAKAAGERAELAGLSGELRAVGESARIAGHGGGFFGKLHENVRLTGDSLEDLHGRLNVVSNAMGAFNDLVIAGLGIGAFGEAIRKVAEQGEQINQLSEKFGMGARSVSALALAAKESGVPLSQLDAGLRGLARTMAEGIASPTALVGRTFSMLGISLTEANGSMRSESSVLGELASKLSTMKDGAEKAAIVQRLMARGGTALLPVLKEIGADGMTPLIAKTEALHQSFSKTAAETDENFLHSLRDAGSALDGLRNEAIGPLIPALGQITGAFVDASKQGGAMAHSGAVLGDILKGLIEVFADVATGTVEVADGLKFIVQTDMEVIRSTKALGQALHGNFSGAAATAKNAARVIATDFHAAFTNIAAEGRLMASINTALWTKPPKIPEDTGKIAAPVLEPLAKAHAVRHSGGGAEVAAARHAAEQIQQIQESSIATAQRVASIKFQTYEQELNKEVAEGKITKSQEIQDEIQAANQEYAAQKSALAKKLALYPQESAAYAKVKDAEVELEASHDRQIAALSAQLAKQQIADAKQVQEAHAKAVAATVKSYQSIVQPINNAFQQTITGVLRGSETLQQGMQKAAQSIVLSFIQGAEKMAVTWAEKQLAMLITTTTTQTAITAAQTAGHAAKAAQDSASIGNDAYKAAAGAYSAVVGIPIVGPVLAPAAAAAAFAGVMAFDVISAEGGMGTVPFNDMPALLHRNEMVLPASIAEPLRIGLPAIAAMPNVGAMMSNQSSTNNSLTYAPNIDASGSGMDMTALESMMMAQQEEMAQLFGVLSNNGSPMLPGR